MKKRLQDFLRRAVWRLAHRLHHIDFAWVLPGLARLPLAWGYALAEVRGRANAWLGRDWRSMALGFRHIRQQSLAAYALLAPKASADTLRQWCAQRFVAEARDEFEACLLAGGRVEALQCRHEGGGTATAGPLPPQRTRGLVLLTPHFDSFVLGIAFAARGGATVHAMASAITQDPRVDPAVQKHFDAKYRGLERYLHGGRVLNMEEGLRPFYRLLEKQETLVMLADSPVLSAGAPMEVDFLGQRRQLAGGALRLAQQSGSDLGGFVCRMERPGHYVMQWCEPGPADDPQTLRRIYAMFSKSITNQPGLWWAADLLTHMPIVPPSLAPAVPAPPAPDYAVLMLENSALQGSAELAFGIARLQHLWPGAHAQAPSWRSCDAQSAPTLSALCEQLQVPYLLVLTDPALLGEPTLPAQLAAALQDQGLVCAVAHDARDAHGQWTPDYNTQVDFERYVARRASLPLHADTPSSTLAARSPKAYMLRLDRLANHPALASNAWDQMPQALGAATVMAPRAYVHSYAQYQQGERAEMLALLPTGLQRLLDVGGGEGGFAQAFIAQRAGTAVVLEPAPQAAQAARNRGLDVLECGLESLDHSHYGSFDAVSFLDVLEHLADPLNALQTAHKLLRPGGVLLLSVPNMGHWSVLRDLAMGRFDYLPVGVLCVTHLRFFTEHSLRALLAQAGFDVIEVHRHGPGVSADLETAVRAMQAAGIACDRDSLATLALHVVAHAN